MNSEVVENEILSYRASLFYFSKITYILVQISSLRKNLLLRKRLLIDFLCETSKNAFLEVSHHMFLESNTVKLFFEKKN